METRNIEVKPPKGKLNSVTIAEKWIFRSVVKTEKDPEGAYTQEITRYTT